MRKYYMILAVGLIIGACQKDEIVKDSSELEAEVVEEDTVVWESENDAAPEEYFRAVVDGVTYEADDPSLIKGTVYPSRNTGVINFDFSGEILDESKEVDFYKGFIFKVCFYDGKGTYYTGTKMTASWAYFWMDYQYWENHYEYGNEPGEVVVTFATDEFVEGSFEYVAYNDYLETTAHVKGEFGIILETPEDYNN